MLFSLLKTARLLRLFRAARKLDRNYEYMTSLLFLMIMFFMLVAHWLACIWYAIGQQEAVKYDGLSWLSILGYQMELPIMEGNSTSGPTLRTRYLTSLYYVMTLCTTVGFGNVSANTDGERIFSICCMLMGGKPATVCSCTCVLLAEIKNIRPIFSRRAALVLRRFPFCWPVQSELASHTVGFLCELDPFSMYNIYALTDLTCHWSD